MSDWDGVNSREGMLFLMLLLPILAPMPIAFAGFWRVLFAAAPTTILLAERNIAYPWRSMPMDRCPSPDASRGVYDRPSSE